MTNHCAQLGDAFDMIKHHPGIFEVITFLHAADEVNTTGRPYFGHFEDVDLVRWLPLSRKAVGLDVGPGTDTSKLCNSIHFSVSCIVLQNIGSLAHMRRCKILGLHENVVELFGCEQVVATIFIEEELCKEVFAGL